MMKKLMSLMLCISISGMVCTTAMANPGDVAGTIYYTDIRTYIYHSPITSYNIGGQTVIDAEIMNWHYGFDVYWYEDTRRLEITDKGGRFESFQAMSGELVESVSGTPGVPYGSYYETDIVTTLNGEPIESYNIGGRTFIVAEAMRDFGYSVDWDENARTLTIDMPADFYKIETNYGTIKAADLSYDDMSVAVKNRGLILSAADGELYALGSAPDDAVYDDSGYCYVKLSYIAELLNAECRLNESIFTGHTELVNGISYDRDYYEYELELNYDENIKPEVTLLQDGWPDDDTTKAEKKVYQVSMDLRVNGESSKFVQWYNRSGEPESGPLLIIDGEIYIPALTLAIMLGYQFCS